MSRPGGTTAASPWGALAAEIRVLAGVSARPDAPMAPHTTMRVGGPADLLAVVNERASLVELVLLARSRGIPHVVIGRGSDLLVSDDGIRGLVILCRTEGWRFEDRRLVAEAGLPMARAATVAQQAGLSGLEFGLAIPGTVGGAVWANAGAHGSDVAAILESVAILGANGEEIVEAASELRLAYRDSRFKRRAGEGSDEGSEATTAGARTGATAGPPAGATAGQELILGATFGLSPASPAEIRARLDEIRRWRREHQPLDLPSAGSVFRNPEGDSAGRLIDACGLKGTRLGGAVISETHANFIVNTGGASASDIRRLAERARGAVARRFGIDLVYEVQFIGDWSDWHPEVA
ncbi:MAG: UDP-N-acetylmuramate dehydrogenase [Candidatus Limnocylindrales bacterium]